MYSRLLLLAAIIHNSVEPNFFEAMTMSVVPLVSVGVLCKSQSTMAETGIDLC